jgi:6-phosphofructokinase 1
MKKIAFLTSGGDSPGMNSCIAAMVKACLCDGIIPIAIFDGFSGLISNNMKEFSLNEIENCEQRGGTIIGTARSEEFKLSKFRKIAIKNLQKNKIDGLIVVGGDGSFTGASILSEEMNIPIIGIPGTIDNDIFGTDRTIGFDSALNTVVQSIDKIRDTASSHHRVFFVEVMGRNSGFIALYSAIASAVNIVLVPEEETNIERVALQIISQTAKKKSTILIVAEGDDQGGAQEIMKKLKPFLPNNDMRATVLGHLQRGGAPTAFDRILATRMGIYAVDLLNSGKSKLMVGLKGNDLLTIPIHEGISLKSNPLEMKDLELIQKIINTN